MIYNSNKKIQARDATIAKFCPSLEGTDLQYWTLAGPCGQDGKKVKGSEFDWAVTRHIIEPHQFHGVDHDPVVTRQNRTLKRGNWYCGDFLTVLRSQRNFNPGLVNFDSLEMPKRGAKYFASILRLLRKQTCVIVGNFVLRTRYKLASSADIVVELSKQPDFAVFWRTDRWSMAPHCSTYAGSGKQNSTKMGSVIFQCR